jgi:hypothetical protein
VRRQVDRLWKRDQFELKLRLFVGCLSSCETVLVSILKAGVTNTILILLLNNSACGLLKSKDVRLSRCAHSAGAIEHHIGREVGRFYQ